MSDIREIEARLNTLIRKTHPDKAPQVGELVMDVMNKIADVIEDLQNQLEAKNED